jgi:membrane protein YqaA with SNARE-associated domain
MNWYSYIIVFLLAGTKFLTSPFVGVNGFGLSVFHTIITVIAGGIFGTIVFYTLGNKLIQFSQNKRISKIKKLKSQGKPLPRIMTKTNKIIVKTKHLFGIWGLAFLTATILSIPIGAIICAKFYRHKKTTMLIIILFVVMNTIVLSLIASLFPSLGV